LAPVFVKKKEDTTIRAGFGKIRKLRIRLRS